MADTESQVALIRGNSLNSWEGMAWNNLPGWSVKGVCSRNNLYPLEGIQYPVVRLRSAADNRVCHGLDQILAGRQQRLFGLEKSLKSVHIAHTAEIYYYYTQQAVRAKQGIPGLKVVTTVWDNSANRFRGDSWPGFGVAPRWWKNKMMARIKESADGVDRFLPVSHKAAEVLVGYGVSEKKMEVLTPAVIPQIVKDNAEVRNLLDDPRPFWLVVNRLVPEKGVEDVITAWASFAGRGTERLVIIGRGPEKNKLQHLVASLALSQSVIFVDHIPNAALGPLYQSAVALLLASRPTMLWEEQFGYVLAEAIVAHCPVIATRSGAIPEVVGDAGILVTPLAPGELSAAMRVMQTSTREKFVRAAAAQALRFTVKRFQTELVRVYDSLR